MTLEHLLTISPASGQYSVLPASTEDRDDDVSGMCTWNSDRKLSLLSSTPFTAISPYTIKLLLLLLPSALHVPKTSYSPLPLASVGASPRQRCLLGATQTTHVPIFLSIQALHHARTPLREPKMHRLTFTPIDYQPEIIGNERDAIKKRKQTTIHQRLKAPTHNLVYNEINTTYDTSAVYRDYIMTPSSETPRVWTIFWKKNFPISPTRWLPERRRKLES